MVYPPTLAIITIVVGYFTIYQVAYFSDPLSNIVFWGGFLIAYWAYDTTHYMLHHVKAKKGSWFHKLQQYHNRHHFSGEEAGFGVSNPFWDIVFNTGFSKDSTKH